MPSFSACVSRFLTLQWSSAKPTCLPGLYSAAAGFNNLRSIDVLALRIWLDSKVKLDTASNVLAGFDEGAGGTLFDLNRLQV